LYEWFYVSYYVFKIYNLTTRAYEEEGNMSLSEQNQRIQKWGSCGCPSDPKDCVLWWSDSEFRTQSARLQLNPGSCAL